MKKGILFLLLFTGITAGAQSLKDALYGGKLKSDTGSVVRKTDDLSTKIDSTKKKPAETEKNKPVAAVKDSSVKKTLAPADTLVKAADEKTDNNAAIKDNNRIWKGFMDSVITVLKAEVLTSKKLKSGTYFILVDYEIGPDGQVSINNVSPSPENSFLTQQVKERLLLSAPVLNPVAGTNGKPRKVTRKYNFTLVKE